MQLSVQPRVCMLPSLFFLSPDSPGFKPMGFQPQFSISNLLPCWQADLPLLPLHCYLFLLPGPDRWECSGIKVSVFTTLFTSIGTSPFGHVGLRKRGPLPSSPSSLDYQDHSGLMRDSSPVGTILQLDQRCVSSGIHCTDPQVRGVFHTLCSFYITL